MLPNTDYADTVCDPTSAKEIESLEMLKHIRFIAGLRARESVIETCSELSPQPLKQRRGNHSLSLLMKILQDEGLHSTLSVAYDESPKTAKM